LQAEKEASMRLISLLCMRLSRNNMEASMADRHWQRGRGREGN
jgi:hypothetical protein